MLIPDFDQTIDVWINALSQYDFHQLCTKPTPQSWSLGQVYMHLIADTNYYLEQIKTCLINDKDQWEEASSAGRMMLLTNAFPDEIIEGAPENALIPQPANPEQVLHDLLQIKQAMREVTLRFAESWPTGKTKHPGLGYFSAADWLQFADLHFRHHLRQKARLDVFLRERMPNLHAMKMLLYTLLLLLFQCFSVADKGNMQNAKPAGDSMAVISKMVADTIYWHKLDKLFVVGNFAGNREKDTLFQHNFSRRYGMEIDSSADPFQMDWDLVENWFNEQDADVFLAFSHSGRDTLHLGLAQGLYCLLNVGDLNADSKEEIAFVADYFGMSRVNSCQIFSLCNGKWTEMKNFGVHEDAFNFTDKKPIFTEIKDGLEKQHGKWVYKDYLQEEFETMEDVGKMQVLRVGKCE